MADTTQNALAPRAAEWRKWAGQSLLLAQSASTEFEREQRLLDYERGIARAKEEERHADRCKGN